MGVAQPLLQLSEKHTQKLVLQDNPVKKRQLYLKYFHKDSLRYVKATDRYWQTKFDSGTNVVSRRKAQANQKLQTAVNQAQAPLKRVEASFLINEDMYRFPPALEVRYSQKHLEVIYSTVHYYLIEMSKDTVGVISEFLQTDLSFIPGLEKINKPSVPSNFNGSIAGVSTLKEDLKNKLGENSQIKEVQDLKDEVGKYSGDFKQYNQYANMTPDSLLHVGMGRLEKEVETQVLKAAGGEDFQKQVTGFTQKQNQYKNQLNSLSDSAARKEMAKQKADELAMQYISDNPGIMQTAQKKMNLLMKKYSFVSNSNDLSSAVKRTSLSGRTFKERLVVAGNFQILSIDPISIDFAPQVGYRFNSLFSMGIGGTYRKTIRNNNPNLAPEVLGYKGFISYDIVKSFFAYGEYAQNSPGVAIQEGVSKRIWKPAALLGVGRRMSVHKKVDMTVVALYNFAHTIGDAIYPRPFMVRFGFQLSDTALLKKKPEVKNFLN
jgi:hypothetical protein